ncbi:hypothetical protein KFE25_008696 [Diacronema lutheri]|uniref:Uncharacterized protein n=2 Tax=Diacronema lutheri TaxID=2081491 RepID=A0A8J5Y2M5_DIALT|nr:hypothetical protein KFE25_008696 [Diacronema lutheri]
MLRGGSLLRQAATLQCRRLSTLADGTLGAEKFFPPLYAGDDKGIKSDKESFVIQFERLKAAVLGTADAPTMKKVIGEAPASLSEADIADLSLADKFLARRLRLQALKYRDYLVESGKLADFKKMTAEQAWAKKAGVDAIKDASFLDSFAAGKVGTDSPAYAALPAWGKEALEQMKADESFVTDFKSKNPQSAQNIEATIAAATAAQKAGGVLPTCAAPRDPSTVLYTIEGTPEYDFQWRWGQQADMIARAPAFDFMLTEEDKAYCEQYNASLVDQYHQFFGDSSITVPEKVTVLE